MSKIPNLNQLLVQFDYSINELEKKILKKFELVYFQLNPGRFGHLWQEPTVVSTLYDVHPSRILIILVDKPFSEFCLKVHQDAGFTYADSVLIKNSHKLYDLIKCEKLSIGELLFNNRYLILPFHNHLYHSKIGFHKGLKPILNDKLLKPYKSEIYNRLNIPSNKKLAILHARDTGWINLAYHDYRNSNINNYIDAIKLLEKENWFIVRIGDASMAKLEYESPSVIDLPHMPLFLDGDDAKLISYCDLYVGQNSGPITLAWIFSKDIVMLNEPNPFIGRFFNDDKKKPKTISLFKHQIKNKKKLSIFQILKSKCRYRSSIFLDEGIELIENSAEEIKSTVWEMLKRKDNKWQTSGDDQVLKKIQLDWITKQLNGFVEQNLGRPDENCYVSHIHLKNISI
jgi:putative glycosyltransferase (TIGR04372 family)